MALFVCVCLLLFVRVCEVCAFHLLNFAMCAFASGHLCSSVSCSKDSVGKGVATSLMF